MKILQFLSEGMHGYLSFTLDLKPDLTFLTGINGSGKTSAVRAITALLTPSISVLANMSYTTISVTVEHEGERTTIQSERSDEELTLTCSGVEGLLQIPILKQDAYEMRQRFALRQRNFYREQETLNIRNSILVAIERLPTPMFLDLERRHQEGTRIRRAGPVNPLAGSIQDSLNDARRLGEETYRELLAVKTALTDALKQEIILAAFTPVKDDDNQFIPQPAFLTKIAKNEELVHESLSQIGISLEQIKETVEPFFKNVREVASRLGSPKHSKKNVPDADYLQNIQDWMAIEPQVRQVNHVAEQIAIYNSGLKEAFAPVEGYLLSVNQFLSDSNKELLFDTSGNMNVSIVEGGRPLTLSALSSGERQLIVILTHLAFNPQAKRANVLIIDEPELSLHIRWQELFVDAVTNASPGLQLILATHSPSIIGDRIDDCIDVGEARNRDRLLG